MLLCISLVGPCALQTSLNQGCPGCSCPGWCCCTGLSLRNFKLDTSKWQLQDGPYEALHLSVARAELVWPSWQDQTLRLQVSGVKLELLQRCMAKVH
jgi:hypothetical protein